MSISLALAGIRAGILGCHGGQPSKDSRPFAGQISGFLIPLRLGGSAGGFNGAFAPEAWGISAICPYLGIDWNRESRQPKISFAKVMASPVTPAASSSSFWI